MNNWDDLKLMLALSRYGTLSSAANSLGMSTATISRRLERCAEEVGQTLFVRRGVSWEPTPAARVFIGLAESVTDGFPNVDSLASPNNQEERVVRLATPLDICMDVLAPGISEFLIQNCGLTIDVFHESKSVAFGEVDLRLSYDEPTEGRLVRLRLGAIGHACYVSDTLDGEPKGWVDVVDFERNITPIGLVLRNKFGQPRVRSASISCAIDVVHEMPLTVHLPMNLANRKGNLVQWGADSHVTYRPIWATYHESRRLDPDVRLMLGYLKSCFVT